MQSALNLLGLCARAGRLVSGLDECEKAIKRRGARLCLVDEGASAPSKKAMEDACRFVGAKLFVLPGGELGRAIGRPGRMAVAVMDQGFAAGIAQRLERAQPS